MLFPIDFSELHFFEFCPGVSSYLVHFPFPLGCRPYFSAELDSYDHTQDVWLEDRSWPWKSGVMMMEVSVKSSTTVVRDIVGLEDDKTVGLLCSSLSHL